MNDTDLPPSDMGGLMDHYAAKWPGISKERLFEAIHNAWAGGWNAQLAARNDTERDALDRARRELTTVVFHLRRDDFAGHDALRQQAIDSIAATLDAISQEKQTPDERSER